MTDPPTVRPALRADLPTLTDLFARAAEESPVGELWHHPPSEMDIYLTPYCDHPQAAVLLAEIDGIATGYLAHPGAVIGPNLSQVSATLIRMDTTTLLADQLDWHWTHQLRPRLDGLTDAEYFWQPVPGCWTVHSDGTVDFAYPPPQPEPFTTIAWRLAHVIVGVLAMRNHAHFGGPEASYQTWRYATDAATALRQLDDACRHWIDGVRGLDDDALGRPVGPAEGAWADEPMAVLILHINREVIHHGAEIACIRDLYAHRKEH